MAMAMELNSQQIDFEYMQSCRCIHCKEEMLIPDVSKCPFCNKILRDETPEYSKKHLQRCAMAVHPYIYSERKRGRPSRDELWAIHGFDIENDK